MQHNVGKRQFVCSELAINFHINGKKYHCIFAINNRDSCVCSLCFMKHILVQSSQSSFCFRVVRAILHFIIHLIKWPFSEFSELLQKCEQAEQKYILDLAFSLETVVS